ncbi:MAG TPA: hypothetical protein VE344_05175 [Methylomirabilota bacterium]|nr:hypothetical protein [Methylomirabilota bacterium]
MNNCRLLANNRLLFVNEHRGLSKNRRGLKNKRDEMMNYFHLLANNWRMFVNERRMLPDNSRAAKNRREMFVNNLRVTENFRYCMAH